MRKRILPGVSLILFFLFLVLTPAPAATAPFNIGVISNTPTKAVAAFVPLLDYLSTHGIDTGKVIVSKDLKQMISRIQKGEIHLISESAYGALQMMDMAGLMPLLIRAKDGVKSYNSVIFVAASSSITSLAELKNRVIAFEDEASTSSYLLPRFLLEQTGLQLIESRKPVPGKVAYYFSKNDYNTIAQVKKGKWAQAGGIKKQKVKGNDDFKILQPESLEVPRHIILIHPEVDAENITGILLGMADDPAAGMALDALKSPAGFFEFPGEAATVMNGPIRDAMGL